MNFFHKLQERVNKTSSLLCIGLDPHISQVRRDVLVVVHSITLTLYVAPGTERKSSTGIQLEDNP
jgi:hypothetical protein